MKELKWEPIKSIRPYEKNPRRNDEAVDAVAASIREFGWQQPIVVDKDGVIIAGHTRYKAAKKLKCDTVPVVVADDLTEDQVKAYRLADNKTGELAEWDTALLGEELAELADFDMSQFGFEIEKEKSHFWGDVDQAETEEYNEFCEKFTPKLTTDDCYTPENVYNCVRDWVFKYYKLRPDVYVMRPFYPGGDYKKENYPDGCLVLDNPPFSILSEICAFYLERGIHFFLFAQQQTLFSTARGICNSVCAGVQITYENGAKVLTGFVTNLGEYKIISAPDLYKAIKLINKENEKSKNVRKLVYPNEVLTGVKMGQLSLRGVELRIKPKDAMFIRKLDAQENEAIYGGGYLLSEKAAAEKAAAEKAVAEKVDIKEYSLSEREKSIIRSMGDNGTDCAGA